MTRLVRAVAVLFCSVTPTEACLTAAKISARPDGLRQLPPRDFCPNVEDVPPPAEAEVTADTEVFLNGRKCDYKDVPPTATVARVVLARDGRTITRIEFRARE